MINKDNYEAYNELYNHRMDYGTNLDEETNKIQNLMMTVPTIFVLGGSVASALALSNNFGTGVSIVIFSGGIVTYFISRAHFENLYNRSFEKRFTEKYKNINFDISLDELSKQLDLYKEKMRKEELQNKKDNKELSLRKRIELLKEEKSKLKENEEKSKTLIKK